MVVYLPITGSLTTFASTHLSINIVPHSAKVERLLSDLGGIQGIKKCNLTSKAGHVVQQRPLIFGKKAADRASLCIANMTTCTLATPLESMPISLPISRLTLLGLFHSLVKARLQMTTRQRDPKVLRPKILILHLTSWIRSWKRHPGTRR